MRLGAALPGLTDDSKLWEQVVLLFEAQVEQRYERDLSLSKYRNFRNPATPGSKCKLLLRVKSSRQRSPHHTAALCQKATLIELRFHVG